MRNRVIKLILPLLAIMLIVPWSVVYANEGSQTIDDSNETLDLAVDGENSWTSVKLDVNAMKPGDSGAVSCKLTNIGNMAGSSLTIALQNLADFPGVTPEPEPTPDKGELSANMDIVLWEDNGVGVGTAGDGIKNGTEATLYSGKLDAEAGPYTVCCDFGAGATTYVGISYSISNEVGNEIQGDSCTFDIVFVLNQ